MKPEGAVVLQPPHMGTGPNIEAVEMAAAHDGSSELVISLRYHSGVLSRVVLDEDKALRLLQRLGARQLADLTNHSWRELLVLTEDAVASAESLNRSGQSTNTQAQNA